MTEIHNTTNNKRMSGDTYCKLAAVHRQWSRDSE